MWVCLGYKEAGRVISTCPNRSINSFHPDDEDRPESFYEEKGEASNFFPSSFSAQAPAKATGLNYG